MTDTYIYRCFIINYEPPADGRVGKYRIWRQQVIKHRAATLSEARRWVDEQYETKDSC